MELGNLHTSRNDPEFLWILHQLYMQIDEINKWDAKMVKWLMDARSLVRCCDRLGRDIIGSGDR